MRRRLLFAVCALGVSTLVFGIGGSLPHWVVWHIGAWEAVGRSASLWEAIDQLPACRREARNDDEFWDFQKDNLTNACILLLVAVGAGAAVYWAGMRRNRTDDRADYKEAPSGSVPDGRVGL